MPARPRRELIDESRVGVYHCFTRCVRRAFLCGEEGSTEPDYSHRKDWVRERLEALAGVFAVDVLDQAALDNHLHVMVRNRPDVVREWSDEDVVRRWLRLHLHQLPLRPEPAPDRVAAVAKDAESVSKYRQRLSNISWFMKYLNEPIAVLANEEDGVSGHFWADRFGSVELPDDPALLLCNLYLDMNEVRAGRATCPEDSKHTGIYERIQDRQSGDREKPRSGWMAAVAVDGDGYEGVAVRRRASNKGFLNINLDEYLELLDWAGRRERPDKWGVIPSELPPILERLGVSGADWEAAVRRTSRRFGRLDARAGALREEARRKRAASGPQAGVTQPTLAALRGDGTASPAEACASDRLA